MAENMEDKLNALVARVVKVRRWLVALTILKVAALCLIFVSVYTGFYAWLDHRLYFAEIGRVTAFVLLVAGLVVLLHKLTKLLVGHVSCSAAANYIEKKRSFKQQLVTAIEYYENKQDYPYSKALAEQLVLNVEKDSREFEFDSTVEKWQGYALAAVILLGLVAASFYVRDNYVYFSSYFARLTRPLASVKPLSSTQLESITKNIVAEPDSEVTFTAGIQGRVPEFGKLVLVELPSETADNNQIQESREMQIRPNIGREKTAQLKATKSFPQTGKFKYRFETDSAVTEWHELNISDAPGIESMSAKITLPRRPPRRKWVKPYTEQIENNTLEVLPGSRVTLDVQATDKLSGIVATGPDGKSVNRQLNGAEQFTFYFNADTNGSVHFALVNEQGLKNENVPDLQVIVKTDEPPKFKLVSPDGDYLATNVASVPVTFEVTDDFGLESVKMRMELPGQQPEEIIVPVEEGVRTKQFTHTIELEEYELTIGDSILFYVEATDIDTGSELPNRTSSSEVYFIEIRPYWQKWVPMPEGKEAKGGASPPVELLNILEYTRAILKKTWAIASKPELTEQDRSRLGFINQDVQYCAEQVALIRDDSQYGFEEPHKVVLNEVIRYYQQTSGHLAAHDAASAMVPEKSAYRILRKFILELELAWSPPPSGQGQQPKKPDSVKLQEKPEFTGYEKERIEAQLKKMQQKLDKITREQKALKWSFENFLEKQAEKKAIQQNLDDMSSEESVEKKGPEANTDGQQSQSAEQKAKSASEGQSSGGGQDGTDEKSPSDESQGGGKGSGASSRPDAKQTDEQSASDKSQGDGQSAGASSTPDGKQSDEQSASGKSQGDGQSAGASSTPDGKQSDEQSASDKSQVGGKSEGASNTPDGKQSDAGSPGDSGSRSPGENKGASGGQGSDAETSAAESGMDEQRQGDAQGSSRGGTANTEARLRMLQAKQHALQEQVSRLKRELQQLPESSDGGEGNSRAEAQEHLGEAVARMDEFQSKMAEARYQPEMDKRRSNDAVALMDSAGRQLDLAEEALGREITLSNEQQLAQKADDMAEQLAEDADALAESVTGAEREEMLARLEAAKRLLEMMPEPQWATVGKNGGTPSGASQVLTRNPNLTPAEAARQMARQFWSIAIDAKKRRQQVIEDESSDVEFYGQENQFFENAARYEQEPVKK